MSDVDMSDEETGVSSKAVEQSMAFSAAESKGKRSAANLPVELEDSLPWYAHARLNCPRSYTDMLLTG